MEELKTESRRSSLVKAEEKIMQDGEVKSKKSFTQKVEEESKSDSRRSSLVEEKKKKVDFLKRVCFLKNNF